MHQDRFFIPEISTQPDLWIEGREAHHILRVKRAKLGEKITLFDGKGSEYETRIVEVLRDKLKVVVENSSAVNREPNVDITIAFSVPKGKRSNFLIQKCSELGVGTLIPLFCERSVVDIRDKSSEKIEKWNKIVIETSKQCKRNLLTIIKDVMTIKDFVKTMNGYDLSLIACHGSDTKTLKTILNTRTAIKNVVCLIGPEGGFTDREIGLAVEMGCIPISLGNSAMRIETAAIAVCSMLQYEYCL